MKRFRRCGLEYRRYRSLPSPSSFSANAGQVVKMPMTRTDFLASMATVALLAGAGLPSTANAQSGARNPAAEQYVQVQAQRALDILRTNHGNPAAEKRLFRAFVDQ